MRAAILLIAALFASPAAAFWAGLTTDGAVEAIAGDDTGVRMTFRCRDGKLAFYVTVGLLKVDPPFREAVLVISADDRPVETFRLTPTKTDKGLLLLAVPSEEAAVRLAIAGLAAKSHFLAEVDLGGGNRASTRQSMFGAVSALTAVLKACNRPLPG